MQFGFGKHPKTQTPEQGFNIDVRTQILQSDIEPLFRGSGLSHILTPNLQLGAIYIDLLKQIDP